MTVTIRELMENYRDSEYTLSDPAASPARIRALTVEKIAALGGRRAAGGRAGRALRIALLAAALTALLSVTAYAVYQSTLADRVLESESDGRSVTYSAVGPRAGQSQTLPPTAGPAGAEQYALYTADGATAYSSMGKNREYEALREWIAFQREGAYALDARELLSYADPHRLIYGASYGAAAKELDAVAARYGLRLMEQEAMLDTEQALFDMLAVEPFYPVAADESHTILVYDDGSFRADGLAMPFPGGSGGRTLGFNICRAARGTLTAFQVLGDDPASAAFDSYTAKGGVGVELALWPDCALLFADMESCHVTIQFYDGTDTGLTMDALRAAADSVDLAALDDIRAPAVAERVAAGMERNMQENPGFYRDVSGTARQVYDELGDYGLDGLLPEGWHFEVSYASTAEDMAERLDRPESGKTPGPADYLDALSISYAPEGSEGYATYEWVTLTYERYWAAPDRALIRNAQAFQNRRVTAVSIPGSYSGEAGVIPCAVGGFEGYYTLAGDYSGHRHSRGVYLTWYDTDKQLLFTLAAPAGSFTVRQAHALAEDFAASIRDIQGPVPTGTVSAQAEPAGAADVSALGRFALTAPAGFAPAAFYGEQREESYLRATQVWTDGSSPIAGYRRILLSWERRYWYEDGMEQAFLSARSGLHQMQADPDYAEDQIRCDDCTVGGFAGYVYQSADTAGPEVCWLDTEHDLWFTLRADDTLADGSALPNADALLALTQTVAETE